MYKKLVSFIKPLYLCLMLSLAFTACGVPEEKIAQAQEKYAQLSEIHNQVVEAHKNVEDNSLDEELTRLQSRAAGAAEYNLAEMTEEEIDKLVQDIDDMIGEYESYLAQLSNIKGQEEEAVLTPIVITLQNRTEVSFSGLWLYEQGSSGARVNVLENLEPLVPGQYLAGLTVMRDVDNTPWMLGLEDESGVEYEIELAVGEYEEGSISLALSFDGEQGELMAKTAELRSESNGDGQQEGEAAETDGDGTASGAEEEESNGKSL
ncbi:MAG: hypothetical protein NC400_10395 [Clostridium sp.]|nr:hypothetical protein [Clostridium sp.]